MVNNGVLTGDGSLELYLTSETPLVFELLSKDIRDELVRNELKRERER
jgi:hypothetical protein